MGSAEKSSLPGESPASDALTFNVLIVGSGVAGLSAAISCREQGFDVVVVEASPEFTHVGAGVFLGGNATRILCEMGLQEEMEKYAAQQQRTVFVDLQDGKTLQVMEFSELQAKIGWPLWQMHRADLHTVLLNRARELGVQIRMGIPIKTYDPSKPAVITEEGTVLTADVILAADGYRSPARSSLLGGISEPRPSGNSAFRALIPCETLKQIPELEDYISWEAQTTHVWVGEGKHVVAYPIRQGEYYNIVTTQPAVHTKDSKYVAKIDRSEVLKNYDAEPRLMTILKHLPKDVLEWRLCDLAPLESWIFPGGRIVLLGDASHAMLPSAAQGAGMGIEDGAAVAELLSRAKSVSGIPAALASFEELRKPRCTAIMTGARIDADAWHGKDAGTEVSTTWSWDYDAKGAARNAVIIA
ncbi:hypothetical protein AUP68_11022 [Ilyonectria robusta]